MQEDNSGMLKGLIIGVLAGGAVGALVALLYAPKSGKELRADIREKTGDLMDDAEQALKEAKNRAGEENCRCTPGANTWCLRIHSIMARVGPPPWFPTPYQHMTCPIPAGAFLTICSTFARNTRSTASTV